jgi:hypothetical protein
MISFSYNGNFKRRILLASIGRESIGSTHIEKTDLAGTNLLKLRMSSSDHPSLLERRLPSQNAITSFPLSQSED